MVPKTGKWAVALRGWGGGILLILSWERVLAGWLVVFFCVVAAL